MLFLTTLVFVAGYFWLAFIYLLVFWDDFCKGVQYMYSHRWSAFHTMVNLDEMCVIESNCDSEFIVCDKEKPKQEA